MGILSDQANAILLAIGTGAGVVVAAAVKAAIATWKTWKGPDLPAAEPNAAKVEDEIVRHGIERAILEGEIKADIATIRECVREVQDVQAEHGQSIALMRERINDIWEELRRGSRSRTTRG